MYCLNNPFRQPHIDPIYHHQCENYLQHFDHCISMDIAMQIVKINDNSLCERFVVLTAVRSKRAATPFSHSNCYAPKETICKRYLPFIENGDLANDVLFIKPSSFSLDKVESSPPFVHYYITNLLPTCCRNSKNPAHFYLCGIFDVSFSAT